MPTFATGGSSSLLRGVAPAATTPAAGSPAWTIKWRKARAGGGGNGTDHYVARRIVGKLPSGATDPRATDPTIAAALAVINAEIGGPGGLVFLLEGTHIVAVPLLVSSNVDIRGGGSGASIVEATFVAPVSYVFAGAGNNQFSDFKIVADPVNVAGMILVGSHTVVKNVEFEWTGF